MTASTRNPPKAPNGSGSSNRSSNSNSNSNNNVPPTAPSSRPSSSPLVAIPPPSVTVAFLIYCALPIAFLAAASLFGPGGDHGSSSVPPTPNPGGGKARGGSVQINMNDLPKSDSVGDARQQQGRAGRGDGTTKKTGGGYQEEVDAMLAKRGIQNKGQQQQQQQQQQAQHARGQAPGGKEQLGVKERVDQYIEGLRKEYKTEPTNVYKALNLADSLRQRDLTYHDGGTAQMEAIETYKAALDIMLQKRKQLIDDNEPTNVPLSGPTESMNDELFLETSAKSTDGLLCAIYCSLAKMYFMANMFEKAVDMYDDALNLAPDYLDGLCYRASTLIILGRYGEAATNYARVLELDANHIFVDAYTGLSKVLVAKEESVPGGWTTLVSTLEEQIPQKEAQLASLPSDGQAQAQAQAQQAAAGQGEGSRAVIVDALKRMHLAMFSYHDSKTKDTAKAWEHLSTAYRHKMSVLAPWNGQHEETRVAMVKQVFHRGFWPPSVGSSSRVPIFIIGFVRSGSTLLERVLDAHPLIVGTGEDSVFNGRLDHIRNRIVEASVSGIESQIRDTVQDLADGVVRDMRARWKIIESNTSKDSEAAADKKAAPSEPQRFADKMLTNYMNVGFIHMLFPKALILHVAREPMDTAFSAFKHDFPPGTLDYTSDFPSLAQLYHGYRDVMEHWDNVLPGRVTHIRYEDMVNDMPGVARSIIDATGLPWDPDVLQFHKKKHAVNTLSTTQVRKGVYKDHLKSWMRYEEQLQPLAKLLGDRVNYDLKTTLPGYEPLPPDEE